MEMTDRERLIIYLDKVPNCNKVYPLSWIVEWNVFKITIDLINPDCFCLKVYRKQSDRVRLSWSDKSYKDWCGTLRGVNQRLQSEK